MTGIEALESKFYSYAIEMNTIITEYEKRFSTIAIREAYKEWDNINAYMEALTDTNLITYEEYVRIRKAAKFILSSVVNAFK